MKNETYQDQVKRLVLDEPNFAQLILKGQHPDHPVPWRQVRVRPVLIKQQRFLQFSYFTQKQDITKNYQGEEAREKLEEALALSFADISVQTAAEKLHIQVSRKGKATIRRERSEAPAMPELEHDRRKNVPLPAQKPDAFLQATGVMDARGNVYPSMQDKFTQINEFLKLLEHTGELDRFEKTPVHILDCGCGSAYLSFAAYHYLQDVRGIPTRLVGIDVNPGLIQKDNVESEQLGYVGACFCQSSIIGYQPVVPPDIVLALHACDTATDEALAQGILHESRLILCAPCCHHHLHEQLQSVAPFEPVFQDGILRKRFADILTDTFRALILRILGYKTDVVEFIAPEHTDKNLMIRAVRRSRPGNARYVREYLNLKAYWNVTPYLETLLGERFTSLLAASPQSVGSSRT